MQTLDFRPLQRSGFSILTATLSAFILRPPKKFLFTYFDPFESDSRKSVSVSDTLFIEKSAQPCHLKHSLSTIFLN